MKIGIMLGGAVASILVAWSLWPAADAGNRNPRERLSSLPREDADATANTGPGPGEGVIREPDRELVDPHISPGKRGSIQPKDPSRSASPPRHTTSKVPPRMFAGDRLSLRDIAECPKLNPRSVRLSPSLVASLQRLLDHYHKTLQPRLRGIQQSYTAELRSKVMTDPAWRFEPIVEMEASAKDIATVVRNKGKLKLEGTNSEIASQVTKTFNRLPTDSSPDDPKRRIWAEIQWTDMDRKRIFYAQRWEMIETFEKDRLLAYDVEKCIIAIVKSCSHGNLCGTHEENQLIQQVASLSSRRYKGVGAPARRR